MPASRISWTGYLLPSKANASRVWIYAEDGLCPCREEWRLDLPLGLLPFVGRYVIYAGMALPYLRNRAHGAISWSIAANGATVPMAQSVQ